MLTLSEGFWLISELFAVVARRVQQKTGISHSARPSDSYEYFAAEQIAVPVLYAELDELRGGSTIEAFHEFLCLRPATLEEATSLPVWGDPNSLLDRFRAAWYWDCTLSPYGR